MTNMIIMILFPTKACGALVTQTTLLPAASSLERHFPIVAIYFSHWRHILLSFPIIGIYLSHCCNILFPLTSYTFPIVVIYFSHYCHILIPLLSYTYPIVAIYLSHCCHTLFPLLSYTFPIIVIYLSHSFCCNILNVTNLVAGIITPNVIQDCLKLDTICLPNPPRGEVCFTESVKTIQSAYPTLLAGIGQPKRVS